MQTIATSAEAQAFDPLALAPEPAREETADAASGLRLELWRQQFDLRRASTTQPRATNRVVLDFRREWTPAEGWRFGLSDRVEVLRSPGDEDTRNALREIYASRSAGSDGTQGFIDAGRINWRNGVATGFNPTDFLRRGAVIEQGTQNPQALRENRLGTVMLRLQGVRQAGSIQLALIPDLAHDAVTTTSGLAPAWDRTNEARALLLKVAPQVGERVSADVLLYARAGDAPRVGSNLTWLAGDAVLAYAEVSGGKAEPLSGPAEATQPARWRNSLATGFTWTSAPGLGATVEYQYDGTALTRARWNAWRETLGTTRERALGALRTQRAREQSPLVQRAWFVRLAWSDAFDRRDLDLAAFVRVDAFDRSRLWQADAAWHLDARNTVRLIVGGFDGNPQSENGSATLAGYGSLSWTRFF